MRAAEFRGNLEGPMQYRKEVDGLRAIAVLPVILFHAGVPAFRGGFVGVDVFFVISGYLITSLIAAERQSGRFTLLGFYERRARRILPALYLVLFACLPFAWLWMLPGDLKAFSDSLLTVTAFSSNLLFWRDSAVLGGYFEPRAGVQTLLHTWSLAVEEQYYLLFPLLLLAAWRLGRRWLTALVFVIAATSLAIAQWASLRHPAFAFFLLPTRAWELLLGALAALGLSGGQLSPALQRRFGECGALLGLLAVGYAVFAFDEDTPFPGLYALVPTLGTALIIVFATPRTNTGRLLGRPLLVGIGLISYSAYLWHQPLLAFARLRSVTVPDRAPLVVLALCALPLAYLSWRYVERPFRQRGLIGSRAVLLCGLAGAGWFAAIGAVGHFTAGVPQRLGTWRATWNAIASIRTESDSFCQIHRRTAQQIASGDICTLGHASIPTMAVIGDSHAGALFDALADSELMASRSFYAIMGGWCAPLVNDFQLVGYGSQDCVDTTRAAFEKIIASASITTVVLVAEWANYTEGGRDNGYGVSSTPGLCRDRDGSAASVSDNAAIVHRSLQKTIDLLSAHGKRVVIVEPTPEFKVRVMDFVVKSAFFSRSTDLREFAPHISLEDYESRSGRALAVLRDVKGVEYVATGPLFCGAQSCSAVDDGGNILFSDTNHVTDRGAARIVAELQRVLMQGGERQATR
jgi:peptidoglycan/LPS O-acetylase OafA/YrhL